MKRLQRTRRVGSAAGRAIKRTTCLVLSIVFGVAGVGAAVVALIAYDHYRTWDSQAGRAAQLVVGSGGADRSLLGTVTFAIATVVLLAMSLRLWIASRPPRGPTPTHFSNPSP